MIALKRRWKEDTFENLRVRSSAERDSSKPIIEKRAFIDSHTGR